MTRERVNVVIPVYRNRATLRELWERLQAAGADAGLEIHAIFIDDGCPERSTDVITELAGDRACVVRLPANRGQQNAIREGLKRVNGAAVVMDADLQDSPELVGELIAILAQRKCDAVFATRRGRYQGMARMVTGWGFRCVMRLLVPRLPHGAGSFVAISAPLVHRLNARDQPGFYTAGLIGIYARRRILALATRRDVRTQGRSAYNFASRWATAYANLVCVLNERLSRA